MFQFFRNFVTTLENTTIVSSHKKFKSIHHFKHKKGYISKPSFSKSAREFLKCILKSQQILLKELWNWSIIRLFSSRICSPPSMRNDSVESVAGLDQGVSQFVLLQQLLDLLQGSETLANLTRGEFAWRISIFQIQKKNLFQISFNLVIKPDRHECVQ